MKIRQNLLFFGTAALLSACGHYSEDLAALDKQFEKAPHERTYAYNGEQDLNNIMTAAGGEMSAISFSEALAREYHALAKTEQEAMDYPSAKLFTEKAKTAMSGQQVQPSAATTQEGQQRRAALMSALETQMTPENYMALARAQAQYDHWQEQKIEGHQGEDINRCRENFEQAMMALENPFTQTKTYAVLFTGQSNEVSPEAQNTLNDIAAFVSEGNYASYQLILSGAPEQLTAIRNKLVEMKFPETRVLVSDAPTAENAVQIDLRYAVPSQEQNQAI